MRFGGGSRAVRLRSSLGRDSGFGIRDSRITPPAGHTVGALGGALCRACDGLYIVENLVHARGGRRDLALLDLREQFHQAAE